MVAVFKSVIRSEHIIIMIAAEEDYNVTHQLYTLYAITQYHVIISRLLAIVSICLLII